MKRFDKFFENHFYKSEGQNKLQTYKLLNLEQRKIIKSSNNKLIKMEPEPNFPKNSKSNQCPISNQINRYRNSLPQIQRSQNHFFFKEIHRQGQQLAYVTLGYQVGQIPFELMDLFAVVINQIHCYTQCNLKIIMDGDLLWVTSTIGYHTSQINSLRYNVQESNINQALIKTQNLIKLFLQKRKKQNRVRDKQILDQVKNDLCKSISLIFKNPNIDD